MENDDLATEYCEAISAMTSSACHSVLKSLSQMAGVASTSEVLQNLHRLVRMTDEISNLVENGNHAFLNGETEGATNRWSRALMLMDILTIDAESLEQELSPNNIGLNQTA